MKKSVVRFLSIAAMVGISSLVYASNAPQQKPAVPIDVTAVAIAVSSAPNHVVELRDEDLLSVASPVASIHGLSASALSVSTNGEVESPEAEGPDDDGPDGPDHEFEGEETGQH
jgi:hypothetical protein